MINKIEKDKKYYEYLDKQKLTFLFAFEIDEILLKKLKLKYFTYQVLSPPLIFKEKSKLKFNSKIVFYGECNINQDKISDFDFKKIEILAYKVLNGSLFYYQIEKIILDEFGIEKYFFLLLKTRNLIRYLFLKELAAEFGSNLILIGDNLKIIKGATHIKSNYSLKFRKSIYENFSGSIFLDLLCKSTSSCVYARSQELFQYCEYVLQLKTFDSEKIYGLKSNNINFVSKDDLINKIKYYEKNLVRSI